MRFYLLASTSEGFGLTPMEAVLDLIIGFDVPCGVQTFVTEGENGYLIPPQHQVDQIASAFAEKNDPAICSKR